MFKAALVGVYLIKFNLIITALEECEYRKLNE
jgi:hypothetical protein